MLEKTRGFCSCYPELLLHDNIFKRTENFSLALIYVNPENN
jgi:hypothetical protein